MPSTIQIVRPIPRRGGGVATRGMPLELVGGNVALAVLVQTSVDAVQAGATLGPLAAVEAGFVSPGAESASTVDALAVSTEGAIA
jgi:hypothetical protein